MRNSSIFIFTLVSVIEQLAVEYMSRAVRKPVFRASDQVRHKPASTEGYRGFKL